MISILSLNFDNRFITNDDFIFKIDFRLLTFGFPNSESLAGGGFKREVADDFTAKEIEDLNPENSLEAESLEAKLTPEDTDNLGTLAAVAYYDGRKISPKQNDILAYIFVPHFSATSLSNLNSPRSIFDNKIELPASAPYPRIYITPNLTSDYLDSEDYKPLELTQNQLQYEDIKPLTYRISLQLYDPKIFLLKEESTTSNPQPETYKIGHEYRTFSIDTKELKFDSQNTESLSTPITPQPQIPVPRPKIKIDYVLRQSLFEYSQSELHIYIPKLQIPRQNNIPESQAHKVYESETFSIDFSKPSEFPEVKPINYSLPKPDLEQLGIPTITEAQIPVPRSELKANYIQKPQISKYTQSEKEVYIPKLQDVQSYSSHPQIFSKDLNDSPQIRVPVPKTKFPPLEYAVKLPEEPNQKSEEETINNPKSYSRLDQIRVDNDGKNPKAYSLENKLRNPKPYTQHNIHLSNLLQNENDFDLLNIIQPPVPEKELDKTLSGENKLEKRVDSPKVDEELPKSTIRLVYNSSQQTYSPENITRILRKRKIEVSGISSSEPETILDIPSNLYMWEEPHTTIHTLDTVEISQKNEFTENEIKSLEKTDFDIETINGLESLIQDFKKLGYEKVSIYIHNTEGNHQFAHNEKEVVPTPSINKIPLAWVLEYAAQEGLIDTTKPITIEEDLVLKREENGYDGIFKNYGSKIGYDTLFNLMLEGSVNSATNHLLKLLGGEEGYQKGMEIFGDIMKKFGFETIEINSLYQRGHDYHSNQASMEDLSKFMHFMTNGRVLKEERLKNISGHLKNEKWSEGYTKVGVLKNYDVWIKPTVTEKGYGMLVYAEGIFISLMLNDPKEAIYTSPDEKAGLNNKSNQLGQDTINAIPQLFAILTPYLDSNKFKRNLQYISPPKIQQQKAA